MYKIIKQRRHLFVGESTLDSFSRRTMNMLHKINHIYELKNCEHKGRLAATLFFYAEVYQCQSENRKSLARCTKQRSPQISQRNFPSTAELGKQLNSIRWKLWFSFLFLHSRRSHTQHIWNTTQIIGDINLLHYWCRCLRAIFTSARQKQTNLVSAKFYTKKDLRRKTERN